MQPTHTEMSIEVESVVYRLQKLKTLASLAHLLLVTNRAACRSTERAPYDSLRVLNKHVTGSNVMRWKRLIDKSVRCCTVQASRIFKLL